MTARDYEHGDRPTCNACGCELDPESDARHDGYNGSPHAHGGRGSYGLGSHHFIFSELCAVCDDVRLAPLRRILDCNHNRERLACGHTHATPHNRWGAIRPGESRRCDKCRTCEPQDFTPWTPPPTWREQSREYREQRQVALCDAIYSDDTPRSWGRKMVKL